MVFVSMRHLQIFDFFPFLCLYLKHRVVNGNNDIIILL